MSDTDNLCVVLLKHAIERANKGYADYAKEAAFYAAILIRDGEELPAEARTYLAEALHKTSLGEDPCSAFKLNGRKNTETLEKEIMFAEAVHRARKAGFTVDYAFDWIVENGLPIGNNKKIKASKDAIKAAYYKHKKVLEERKED